MMFTSINARAVMGRAMGTYLHFGAKGENGKELHSSRRCFTHLARFGISKFEVGS